MRGHQRNSMMSAPSCSSNLPFPAGRQKPLPFSSSTFGSEYAVQALKV